MIKDIVRMLNFVGKTNDLILRILEFHGTGRDYVEKSWFTCEVVWEIKQITNEEEKIA